MRYKELMSVGIFFVIGLFTGIYANKINDWNSWIVLIAGLILCFFAYKLFNFKKRQKT